jgi:hypothetical protein
MVPGASRRSKAQKEEEKNAHDGFYDMQVESVALRIS